MTDPRIPIVETILHPTDFSPASRVAFYHALRIALLTKSRLTLLHAEAPEDETEWLDFPGVRETLERWKYLPPLSLRSAVPKLGIDVRKLVSRQGDPVKAVLRHLEEYPADLIVLAAHQDEGQLGWMRQRVAEPLARQAAQMTLFIREDTDGFISAADGTASLQNVLIPVADVPPAQPAVEAAVRLVNGLDCPRGTFTLLHVGEAESMPEVRCPELSGWEWKRVVQSGNVIDAIVDAKADLIVMATDGRNGFLDALRGSHSERVLRGSPAPLLTVPVGSLAADYLR